MNSFEDTFVLVDECLEQKIYRFTYGSDQVGCQGMFFFENRDEGHKFSNDIKTYLKSLRDNTDEYLNILHKWKHDRMLRNYLIELKHLVEEEKPNPAIWVENGVFYSKEKTWW